MLLYTIGNSHVLEQMILLFLIYSEHYLWL